MMSIIKVFNVCILLILFWPANNTISTNASLDQFLTEPIARQCDLPKGSIPCKVWNYTNTDCIQRKLDCIPSFTEGSSIRSLDLSINVIKYIPYDAFPNLHQLRVLTFQSNSIYHIADDAFENLQELQSLTLSKNNISVIQKKAFTGLQKLQILSISSNSISHIKDGAFEELPKLIKLELANNFLNSLQNDSFRGLCALQYLDLQNNPISTDKTSGFHHLFSLNTLLMSNDNGITITKGTFVSLQNLQNLVLGNTYLDTYEAPLSDLVSLNTLEITSNIESEQDCTNIRNLFTGLSKLKYLKLHVNGYFCSNFDICPLSSLRILEITNGNINDKQCTANIPLEALNFRSTQDHDDLNPPYHLLPHLTDLTLVVPENMTKALTALQLLNSPLYKLNLRVGFNISLNVNTFASFAKWNTSLSILKFLCEKERGCKAINIGSSVFKWFPSLKILHLETTATTLLIKDSFEGLKNLHELEADYTPNIFASGVLQVFSKYNTLKIINFGGLMSGDISSDGFCKIPFSLQKIDLSNNQFTGFPDKFQCKFQNVNILNIGAQTFLKPWYFKTMCQTFPNVNEFHAHYGVWITSDNCTTQKCQCSSLSLLDLSESLIMYNDKDEIFTPNLEILLLSTMYLKDIKMLKIFKSDQLKHLDLSSNQIPFIDDQDISYFSNLTHLDVSQNQLQTINFLQYLDNLKTLILYGNQLTTIPKFILSRISNLQSVTLYRNKFICDCNIEPLAKWLVHDKVVNILNSQTGFCCNLPSSKKGLSITEIDLDCKPRVWKYILLGTFSFVIVLTLICVAVWYRWNIRYGLFLLFRKRRAYQYYLINDDDGIDREDNDEDGVPRYDAYVTYHRRDEDWVADELVENIEEGEEPFRLCLRTRDIRAGRLIFNELSLHIQRSRKILVVLSPHFVEDNWCYFELNMAHHRVLEENKNVMIFIILEEIPDNRLTLLLRQLFCKVQVIKWPGGEYGQDLFWRRLREELKRPVPLDRRFDI